MYQKVKKTLFFIFCYPFIQAIGYIIIGFLVLLSFFLNIKLAYARTDRIGELLPQFSLYLSQKKKPFTIWFFNKPYCNVFLVNKIKPLVKKWVLGKTLFNFCFKKLQILCPNLIYQKNSWELFKKNNSFPPFFYLNKDENDEGCKFLKRVMKKSNNGFVCLMIRDERYLTNKENANSELKHAFRNTNFKKYFLLIKYLTKNKYYVFRMGKNQKKINFNDSYFFDYANSNVRSDFLDVFLGLNCKFSISTNSGWDLIPNLGKIPIAYLNYYPLAYFPSFMKRCIGSFQKMYSTKQKRFLSLKEIFKLNIAFAMSKKEALKNQILVKQCSSRENLETVKELLKHIHAKFILSSTQKKLQNRFWKNFNLSIYDETKSFKIHKNKNLLVSEYFIRNNPNLLRSS